MDIYSDVRREKYQSVTDVVSQDNIRRLYDQDPDQALEKDEFLRTLKRNEGNVEAQRELLRSSNALKYDFTQHYSTATQKTQPEQKNAAVSVQQVAAVAEA